MVSTTVTGDEIHSLNNKKEINYKIIIYQSNQYRMDRWDRSFMREFYKLTVNSPATSYIPLPRFLLQDAAFQDLSNDSKVLYAMLLDRASISRQNGYVEPDGTIRLYFTLEQAQVKLHRSRQSATRIFRELECSGLIIRRKQGLGRPALITLNYPADAKLIVKEADTHVG